MQRFAFGADSDLGLCLSVLKLDDRDPVVAESTVRAFIGLL
jgi:hypothetical protein